MTEQQETDLAYTVCKLNSYLNNPSIQEYLIERGAPIETVLDAQDSLKLIAKNVFYGNGR